MVGVDVGRFINKIRTTESLGEFLMKADQKEQRTKESSETQVKLKWQEHDSIYEPPPLHHLN